MKSGCLRALSLLFVLLLVLATAGYFLRHRYLPLARAELDRRLENERLFLDFRVAWADVRPNIVTLRNITLYRDSTRKEAAATLDHLSLRIPVEVSIRNRAPEFIASAHDAKFVVFTPTEPVVWEHLTFTYHRSPKIRSLDNLQATIRGLTLNLAARWEPGKKEQPATTALTPPAPAAAPTSPVPPSEPPSVTPSPAPPATPAAPTEPILSDLDLSALVSLAQALDYRKAAFHPELSIQAEGKRTAGDSLSWKLLGTSRSFPSNAVDLNLDASWAPSGEGIVAVNEFSLVHGKRKAQLQGTYRRAEETFEISQCESTVDWTGILRDVPSLPNLTSLQTVAPPQVTLRGTHHLGHPEKSKLSFTLGGWALDYQVAADRPPLEVRDLQCNGTLQDGALEVPSFQAAVANGSVSGEVSASPFAAKPTWRSSFDAQGLALERLVKPSQKMPAQGLVEFSFAGYGSSSLPTLQGQGKVKISNGRFLDLDILGSLLRYLEPISPSLGSGTSDQITGKFVVRDGVVRTDDLLLEVSASQIAVKGQVDLTSKQTYAEAHANLRGLLSTITQFITDGQGLVIVGTGAVDKIDWKLKGLGKAGAGSDSAGMPQSSAAQGSPSAPSGSLKDQIKQQAMESLLNGSAEQAVGALLKGIKERRALRKQEREATSAPTSVPPQN